MVTKLVLGTILCLAVKSLATSGNGTAHDRFISSNKGIDLTLIVANDSDDLFFSFSGPSVSSWISFGLGSNRMESSLMFLIYASSSGKNITLSPRLPVKHAEPTYSSNIQVEVLSGSGISNGTMTANFRCGNCRWNNNTLSGNYNLNISSTSQRMCFASGPPVDLKSDNLNAALMRHVSYGSFVMDMVQAAGEGAAPVVPANITNVGSVQTSFKADHDASAQVHGGIMILTFMCLMPFGVSLLRIWGLVKWHAINQGFAAILALVGTAIGINIGTQYNRSKNFNTGHQIIGIIIFVAAMVQVMRGYMHHRIYKKTQVTTKLAPVHVWLGRFMIIAAVICAFLGFPLALSPSSNAWFSGVVIVICCVAGLLIFWKSRKGERQSKMQPNIRAYPQISEPNGLGTHAEQLTRHSSVKLQQMRVDGSGYGVRNQEPQGGSQNLPVVPWQPV